MDAEGTTLSCVVVGGVEEECVICLDVLTEGVSEKLPCEHHFHSACIREWWKHDPRCPICRHECPNNAAPSRRVPPAQAAVIIVRGHQLLVLAPAYAILALLFAIASEMSELGVSLLLCTTVVALVEGSKLRFLAVVACKPLLLFGVGVHCLFILVRSSLYPITSTIHGMGILVSLAGLGVAGDLALQLDRLSAEARRQLQREHMSRALSVAALTLWFTCAAMVLLQRSDLMGDGYILTIPQI